MMRVIHSGGMLMFDLRPVQHSGVYHRDGNPFEADPLAFQLRLMRA
jgi:hypothetical protein